MSLTRFVELPDVKAKIKTFRPKLPRKINASLKVAPGSNRYSMVGTAFDYFLRFELQRRASHAVSARWIADYAPDRIYKKNEDGSGGGRVFYSDHAKTQPIPPGKAGSLRPKSAC